MFTIEELIKMGLSEKDANAILEGIKKNDEGKIPLSRLNEVIKERDGYKSQLNTLQTDLNNLKTESKDAETLKNEILNLRNENEKNTLQFKEEFKKLKIENAIEVALMDAKVKNPKAVKPFINLSDILLTEDGKNVVGLKEQIDKLKEDEATSFLFESSDKKINGITPNNSIKDPKPIKKDSEKSYWDYVDELENE